MGEKNRNFLSENFHFFEVKFYIHLNMRIFVTSVRSCCLMRASLFPYKDYRLSMVFLTYFIHFFANFLQPKKFVFSSDDSYLVLA